jgi:muramoyltetrapeptide carboxypeptidase
MGKNALQIIEDVTKKYNIPVVYNFGTHPRQQSAGYGSIVHLDVSAEKVF